MIVEEHDCIAIWESFSPYAVAEDYFLFTTQIRPLNLSIVADYLVLDCGISWVRSTMIPGRHLHFVVFRFSFRILFFLLLLAALFWSSRLVLLLVFVYFRDVVDWLVVLILHVHFILNFIFLPLEFFKSCLSLNSWLGSLFTTSSKSLVEDTWTYTCLLGCNLNLLLQLLLLWNLRLLWLLELLLLNLLNLLNLLSSKLTLSLISKLFIIICDFVA